ncbi:MAG: ABC transporter ATP-binding protein [Sulfolobales archaeon]
MSILETKNLFSGYGSLKVLFDINFKAEKSKITVVVGPNGAGKTTLLNSITGNATIFSGSILFKGRDIRGLPPHKIARLGISYVPQMGNVFSSLTVEENLKMAGYLLSQEEVRDRINEIYDLFPVLSEYRNRRAGTLSGGERRMLAIGIGLMRRPEIMLLDEITTDLAPKIVKRVLDTVVELRDRYKMTIILVEQHATRALQIGDKSYLLVSGTIRYEGDPISLLKHPEFSRLYLGIT